MRNCYIAVACAAILAACGGSPSESPPAANLTQTPSATPTVSQNATGDSIERSGGATAASGSAPLASTGIAPMLPCGSEFPLGSDRLRMTFVNPAQKFACEQIAVDTATTRIAHGGGLAAFNPAGLQYGFSEFSPSNVQGVANATERDRIIAVAPINDVGSAGEFGELWWARYGPDEKSEHVFGGQSFLARAESASSYASMVANAFDFSKPIANPLPQTGSQTFEQIGATKFSFSAGTLLPLGIISNAKLVLAPASPISAVLKLTMTRGGSVDNVTIPLKADISKGSISDQRNPAKLFALRATKAAGSQETCSEPQGGNDDTCEVMLDGGYHVYTANGKFFGGNAEYLAIRFETNFRGSAKGEGGYAQGLVVLKRVP